MKFKRKRLSVLKVKLTGVWTVLKSKYLPIVNLLNFKDIVSAVVFDSLQKHLVASEKQHEDKQRLIDTVIKDLEKKIDEAANKKINLENLYDIHLSLADLRFSRATGLAALWELKIRFLCDKLNITTVTPALDKSKKRKNQKIIELKELDELIKSLRALLGEKENLKFVRLKMIRNELTHGNLQAVQKVVRGPAKSDAEKYKGHLFVIDLKDTKPEPRRIEDEVVEPENEPLFGWYMNGTNSELLEQICYEFNDGIGRIHALTQFHAFCFDERKQIWDVLINEKRKLKLDEIEIFCKLAENHKGFGLNRQSCIRMIDQAHDLLGWK